MRNQLCEVAPRELPDADLEGVVAGKEGFGRKLWSALWSSSGFNPANDEPWRTSFDPPPTPPPS